jgi:hypothetical protein
VDGTRVPDADELELDARNAILAAIKAEEALKKAAEEAEREKILAIRMAIIYGSQEVKDSVAALQPRLDTLSTQATTNTLLAIESAKTLSNPNLAANQLKTVYNLTTNLKDAVAAQVETYTTAKEGLEYLKERNAFDASYIAQLEANLDADLETARAALATIDAQAVAYATAAYDAVVAAAFDGLTVNPYVYAPVAPDGEGEAIVEPEAEEESIYQVEKYTIVHQTYENGTELLLNFNDYRVIVELDRDGDGVKESSYTVEAYGYVVIGRAA